ncbi:juvenile hormone esterase-like isoform X1 [Macrobrachium rosenbergii]|uniref:juvenile hormone esterase-like isoform X1 n=1 Tax=Macrobrachium rosenbergii TaxID=79674 RepID=UPI0034D48FC0
MGVIGFLLVLMATILLSEGDNSVIVSTRLGKISGFKEQSTEGNPFYSFHSVPYAQPPTGSLRLKDPVPVKSWSGIKNGSVVPATCPQIPFIEATLRTPVYDGNEDCLYLSIFTSKPNEEDAALPVMVFIHGGAFFSGGINWYAPYVLMNEGVVFVIIQYRLGILGFLSTEDDVIPGNFGVKDQVLALQWIQENIHYFGGDKTRVTIFGESAGGASVHFHVLSPYSKGLFSGGIMQSGTLLNPWAMGGAFMEVAMHMGKRFDCQGFSVPSEQASKSLLSCLQRIDVVNLTLSLQDHIHWNFNPVLLGPRVDGDYLPAEPEVLVKEGRYNKVNLMSGVTSHEGGLFVFPLFSSEALRQDLLNNFKEMGPASLDIRDGDASPAQLAQRIFDHYVGGVKVSSEDADNLCEMYGDWQFVLGHDLVAKFHTKTSPEVPIYLYQLNHRGQRSIGDYYSAGLGGKWVCHADDLFYLFTGDNTYWKPLEREEDLRLRKIITKLWYNFAVTGNPTPDNSLGFTWKPASEDYFVHLSLVPSPFMEEDKRQEVRKFLESLPTKLNYILHPDSVSAEQLRTLTEENTGVENINSPRKYLRKTEL